MVYPKSANMKMVTNTSRINLVIVVVMEVVIFEDYYTERLQYTRYKYLFQELVICTLNASLKM